MEVIKTQIGDALEVKISGRLDGYWADHLNDTLEQSVRQGAHRIRLNLAEVSYLSSAGIGVVVKFYKELADIQGSLVVSEASPFVKRILEIVNLGRLLSGEQAPAAQTVAAVKLLHQADFEMPTFEVRDEKPGATLTCRVIGDAGLLQGCRFSEADTQKVPFPESAFGLGLGAFGETFEDCSGRFGEFLAVAGAAAYQPTDGTNMPDYLLASGQGVPELTLLYGMLCTGQFTHQARFDPKTASASAGLADIAGACLDIAGTGRAGVVMVAESAGLTGAALRRSPALDAPETAPFRHPEIRQWLSFTAERAFVHSLTVTVGVVARDGGGALAPMLRPLTKESPLAGHFHAAAFPYRPVKKGRLDLKSTVAALFEAGNIQGVLHLLGDDRGIGGAGQSEFVRGICWVAPISEITT